MDDTTDCIHYIIFELGKFIVQLQSTDVNIFQKFDSVEHSVQCISKATTYEK